MESGCQQRTAGQIHDLPTLQLRGVSAQPDQVQCVASERRVWVQPGRVQLVTSNGEMVELLPRREFRQKSVTFSSFSYERTRLSASWAHFHLFFSTCRHSSFSSFPMPMCSFFHCDKFTIPPIEITARRYCPVHKQHTRIIICRWGVVGTSIHNTTPQQILRWRYP